MNADLRHELNGYVDLFDGTPHGDFLARVAKTIADDGQPPAGEVLRPDDVQALRDQADGAEIIELCDSHERLRRLWRHLRLAIEAHEYSIVEGRRDPTEVDGELWANT